MLVSWNWLKEYVRLDVSIDDLVERLTLAGLNHESVEEVDGDLVIDIEVTSNRPDCLGHIGIAREAAALLDNPLKLPDRTFAESGTPIESLTSVSILPEAASWCPQYRARVVEGVKIGPSPDWLQRRLRSVGVNPVNNVVDITNYVLLECGQPLHAFDIDKLDGRRIVVRNARDKEPFRAINNRGYELTPWMGVIADGSRPVALAGIMGGADSEVSDRTTTVLLESAEFAPLAIRRGSRALDLSSESSYRFERKVDPAGIAWASDRACHLLCEVAGGKVARGFLHCGQTDYARAPVALRWSRLERLLGVAVPPKRCQEILVSLGIKISAETADQIAAVPPTHRRDLTREIDLIEEIGRIHGYEALAEDAAIPMSVSTVRRQDRVVDKVRGALTAFGYCEAVTFTFSDIESVESVRPWTDSPPLTVAHSSRKQENRLRQSTIPSLLRSLRINESRGNQDIELFEVAHVYLPVQGGLLPEEPAVVGLVSNQELRRVRGHVDAILERLHVAAEFVPAPVTGLAADQSGEYRINGKRVAVIGSVSEKVRAELELRGTTVVAELRLAPLIDRAALIPRVKPIPDQPMIERDFNFVLDESVRWSDLERLVRQTAGPYLEDLQFVDLYRGKQVPAGKKSITFRRIYRAPDRTLTHAEVDQIERTIESAIRDQHGGVLRK